MTFNLRNGTERAFRVTAIIAGFPFSLSSKHEFPFVLEPDDTCTVEIAFEPREAVRYEADIEIHDDVSVQRIAVEGQGSLTASTGSTPSPPKRESGGIREEETLGKCLEALHALELYAKAIERKVEELSFGSRPHVSWDPTVAASISTASSSPSPQSSPAVIAAATAAMSLGHVLERLSKLESMYGLISSKLGISDQQQETEVLPETPMPSRLNPEDVQLLEDMGVGPGAEARPTGKTPARWRDFVTGAAAEFEEQTPAKSLFTATYPETPVEHTPMGRRSRSPVQS